MALANELEIPQPLDGSEIKEGIAHKVAAAVLDSLNAHCAFYGKAYPKFRATILINFVLDDFGRIVEGTRTAEIEEGPVSDQAISLDVDVEIPETPPNVFRKETEQAVPTLVQQGSTVREQRISYAGRKGKLGRSR